MEEKNTNIEEAAVQEEQEVREEACVNEEPLKENQPAEKKKKTRKNAKSLELELSKKAEEITELKDRYQRLMAEFENARKRTAKESTRMYDVGAKEILTKLLPVVDNFERGLSAVPEEDKEDAFVQGIDAIYKQLMVALEETGVKPIDAVGQEFNADLHNAVMHTDDEELGENIVAEEFQKGYMYKEEVLRHSMVRVVN